MVKDRLVLGSRESALAMAQTHMVRDALQAQHPGLTCEIKTFKTQGDIILDVALSKVGDKGLFVKELEVALLAGEIDLAVHSMKDMPSEQPEGLKLVSFGKREVPFDALVSRNHTAFEALPQGAVIGTSSLRREACLRALRPDLKIEVLRGNVQTRLCKLDAGQYDAIVLAAAGLHRLGLEARITSVFSPADMLPACCQGILALEYASDAVQDMLTPLVDPVTQTCASAERAFLQTLNGGCQIPMGAYATPLEDGSFVMHSILFSDGGQCQKEAALFKPHQAEATGRQLAQRFLSQMTC